jgi:hypothetical protein
MLKAKHQQVWQLGRRILGFSHCRDRKETNGTDVADFSIAPPEISIGLRNVSPQEGDQP